MLESPQMAQELKAHVQGGRYVIDGPAQHPEGCELRLVAVEGDELGHDERARLQAALDEAAEEIERGEVVSEAAMWASLRNRQ
jgi:hypothetical protein